MLIGYARVSTSGQTLDVQTDVLKSASCERVFTDVLSDASDARADRHGLEEDVTYGRPGDVLVLWPLDRLGRSLQHLIETVVPLEHRGIGFRSPTGSIDTATPGWQVIASQQQLDPISSSRRTPNVCSDTAQRRRTGLQSGQGRNALPSHGKHLKLVLLWRLASIPGTLTS
jgi:DNA invertase Pin-like site-specific DNA recombinase